MTEDIKIFFLAAIFHRSCSSSANRSQTKAYCLQPTHYKTAAASMALHLGKGKTGRSDFEKHAIEWKEVEDSVNSETESCPGGTKWDKNTWKSAGLHSKMLLFSINKKKSSKLEHAFWLSACSPHTCNSEFNQNVWTLWEPRNRKCVCCFSLLRPLPHSHAPMPSCLVQGNALGRLAGQRESGTSAYLPQRHESQWQATCSDNTHHK